MDDIIKIINDLLDLFIKLGINPLYIIAIMFVTTTAKFIDKKRELKRWYVLFPLIAALLFFVTLKPFVFNVYIINSCVHAAVSSFSYTIYSKLLKKKGK